MSDCCGGTQENKAEKMPTKRACPACGHTGLSVPFSTMLHHLKSPWQTQAKDQPHYFCDDAECDIVYFGADDSTISRAEIRTKMAVKGEEDGLICFCYGVNAKEAQNGAIKEFVMAQTKLKNCACDVRNPSGRCCLKNFPK